MNVSREETHRVAINAWFDSVFLQHGDALGTIAHIGCDLGDASAPGPGGIPGFTFLPRRPNKPMLLPGAER